MSGSSKAEAPRSWYRRFVERLDPGERLGELLFGLIMVLTFTLGAGIQLGDRDETRDLLIAALGCNAAWGIIDAALYLIARLSERGRIHRTAKRVPEVRAALDADVLERVREMKLEVTRVGAEDLWAALAVFWLVFLTALPAMVPFLVIRDPQLAMRTSNALLIGGLFYVGWRWASYTGARPWRTGLFMALLGVLLVLVAIALGG